MWKCLFKILALRCEDETLSTTETSLNIKRAIWENSCLILLVIICTLVLADVSIGCFTITQDIEKYKKKLLPYLQCNKININNTI